MPFSAQWRPTFCTPHGLVVLLNTHPGEMLSLWSAALNLKMYVSQPFWVMYSSWEARRDASKLVSHVVLRLFQLAVV